MRKGVIPDETILPAPKTAVCAAQSGAGVADVAGNRHTGFPGPFQPTEAEAASSGRRTAAYVYDRAGLQLRDSDAPHLDQLNYSFALIQNGEVSGSHWQSIDVFRRYVERHPHILPVLAIGGWGADGFSQAASTADGRARFVDSTLVLMERPWFSGCGH